MRLGRSHCTDGELGGNRSLHLIHGSLQKSAFVSEHVPEEVEGLGAKAFSAQTILWLQKKASGTTLEREALVAPSAAQVSLHGSTSSRRRLTTSRVPYLNTH